MLNALTIPEELRKKRQWILWKWEPDAKGKQTKIPYKINGQRASSTNPEDWTTFGKAYSVLVRLNKEFAGLGYVFNRDIIGIDLDYAFYTEDDPEKNRKAGQLKPWAKVIVERFDTYMEYSPTRINGIPKGIHILLSGTAEMERHKRGVSPEIVGHQDAIEVYTQDRFFTVTGDSFGEHTSIKPVVAQDFAEWYSDTFPAAQQIKDTTPSGVTSIFLPPDHEILDRMRNSRNGSKFRALFDRGEWEQAGFPSQSEADLSLAGNLMFFACNRVDVADRLFRSSKLMRNKWDEKRGKNTYGLDTLRKAVRASTINWRDPNDDDPQELGVPIRLFGDLNIEKTDIGYITRQPVHNGEVTFTFTEIMQSRQKLEAYIEVQIHPNDDKESTPYANRYDIKSPSQQGDLVTNLNKAFGDNKRAGYNWTLIANTAFQGLIKRLQSDTGIVSGIDQEYVEPEFLLYPFLQKDAVNMFFASSETGKSWTALLCALSIATGKPILDYAAPFGLKTLYIDYEDSQNVFFSRMHRLSAGMGVDFKDAAQFVEYLQPMGSIRDNVEALRKIITERNYALIIIDAGGDAAGGSPNDEQKVIDLFNALQILPGTKLLIHHEPKDTTGRDDTSAFYGSMYWRGRSRVAWRMVKESEDKDGATIKMSIAKKSNLGRIEAIYYKIMHESREQAYMDNGRTTPKTTIRRTEEGGKLDETQAILSVIGEEGATIQEVSRGTWLTSKQARIRLEKMAKDGVIKVVGSKRGARWVIAGDNTLDSGGAGVAGEDDEDSD